MCAIAQWRARSRSNGGLMVGCINKVLVMGTGRESCGGRKVPMW